ncbi:uncharacterized protein PHA67_013619 isoform 1-T2 [Liasis olivaceus]
MGGGGSSLFQAGNATAAFPRSLPDAVLLAAAAAAAVAANRHRATPHGAHKWGAQSAKSRETGAAAPEYEKPGSLRGLARGSCYLDVVALPFPPFQSEIRLLSPPPPPPPLLPLLLLGNVFLRATTDETTPTRDAGDQWLLHVRGIQMSEGHENVKLPYLGSDQLPGLRLPTPVLQKLPIAAR